MTEKNHVIHQISQHQLRTSAPNSCNRAPRTLTATIAPWSQRANKSHSNTARSRRARQKPSVPDLTGLLVVPLVLVGQFTSTRFDLIGLVDLTVLNLQEPTQALNVNTNTSWRKTWQLLNAEVYFESFIYKGMRMELHSACRAQKVLVVW